MMIRTSILLLGAMLAAAPALAGTEGLQALVEREAERAALSTVEAPDRFEILSSRFGGSDPIPEMLPELETVEVAGPNRSGIVRIRFRMTAGGRTLGEARATVRGQVRGPALASTRVLARGQQVSREDVEQVDADLTRLDGDPIRKFARLADLAPVRTLGAGRVLVSTLLVPAPVVRKGDTVDLYVRKGRLQVRARGIARRDAAPGETVAAVNPTSGAELLGEVQPDGSVVVVRGPLPGRSRP
jgi:flagella basal body P-ring formation protein FlgA